MKLGAEIRNRQIILAAAEDDHFMILETADFSSEVSIAELAGWLAENVPLHPEDSLCISMPSIWSITQRRMFADALKTAGISRFLLTPDCVAVMAFLQNQGELKRQPDLIYLQEAFSQSADPEAFFFSFLTAAAGDAALLWEGSFAGSRKFFRKMANMLGFSYKSKWSEHLLLCGQETVLNQIFTSASERSLPRFFLPEEAILQAVTLYEETVFSLLSHLQLRLHSRFSLSGNHLPEEKNDLLPLPVVVPLTPLAWQDYHCLYFFSPAGETPVPMNPDILWQLYEKPLWKNEWEELWRHEPHPLAVFSLTEPMGLWMIPGEGATELMPFVDHLPPLEITFPQGTEEELYQQLEALLTDMEIN